MKAEKIGFRIAGLAVLLAGALPAAAVNIVVTVQDFSGNPDTSDACVAQLNSAPAAGAAGVAAVWRGSFTTDPVLGSFTISNAAPGWWTVTPGNDNTVPFSFCVPSTNAAVLRAETLLAVNTNGSGWTAWSAAADGRYSRNLYPASNVSFVTNADGSIAISATGGTTPNAVTFTTATNLAGATNGWYYNAAFGSLGATTGTMYLLTSPDQTNWTLAVPTPLYRDPDAATTNYFPFARECFPLEHNGRVYMVYAQAQFSHGNPSIGIAVSTDLTNYSRIALLHPMPAGLTNDFLWATTVYEETNGADYIVFPYSTNGDLSGNFRCYAMPRLDETWTNWGAPQLMLGTNFVWDGFVIRQSATNLLLYQASASVYQATNIYGPWGLAAGLTQPGSGAESPRIFALATNNWVFVDQTGGRFGSTNAGLSWTILAGYFGKTPAGAPAPFTTTGTGFFNGGGVFNLLAPLTNTVVTPLAAASPLPQTLATLGNASAQRITANDAQIAFSLTAPAVAASNLTVSAGAVINGGIAATGALAVVGAAAVSSLAAGSSTVAGNEAVGGNDTITSALSAGVASMGNNSAQGTSVVTRVISLGPISIGTGTNALVSTGEGAYAAANQAWGWYAPLAAYTNANNQDVLALNGDGTWHYSDYNTGSDEWQSPGATPFGQWLSLGADYPGAGPLVYPAVAGATMSSTGFAGNGSGLTGLPTNGFITQLQANLAATNAAQNATNTLAAPALIGNIPNGVMAGSYSGIVGNVNNSIISALGNSNNYNGSYAGNAGAVSNVPAASLAGTVPNAALAGTVVVQTSDIHIPGTPLTAGPSILYWSFSGEPNAAYGAESTPTNCGFLGLTNFIMCINDQFAALGVGTNIPWGWSTNGVSCGPAFTLTMVGSSSLQTFRQWSTGTNWQPAVPGVTNYALWCSNFTAGALVNIQRFSGSVQKLFLHP